ncbi:hypothetical protein C8A01DRAFT_50035 [Parachaetomium inaequale]|uniref:Uncharacterized protein n=1 Tax=Parachaetomium inaequale TaxID=2588326 RepID=A0AAN6PC94_9PEZI|nr:hypothetical protein C8A01DRAFT_50035 [Parachaetomium inaequale]
MPPKRAAPASSAASRAKRSRPSTEGTNDAGNTENENMPFPRNKRWSAAISGSANADMEYRIATRDPAEAYSFVCLCQTPFPNGEKKRDKRPKCDGGVTCLCNKPAAEHPNHLWILSFAGKRKFHAQDVHCELRCPDNFGMYTFNKHVAYGILEVLQNLILDFEEAADNYRERWAVCEALAFFLKSSDAMDVTRVGGDTVDETFLIIGRLFMTMLAQLQRENLLSSDSEIKNLGLIMALFMDFARLARQCSQLTRSNKQSLGPAKDKRKWFPHAFDNQILAYAGEYNIELAGPHNMEELEEKAGGTVDLPLPASNTAKTDPFAFTKNLTRYKKEQGGLSVWMALSSGCHTPSGDSPPIGGDNLDITTWSSEKRKEKSFDDKDPLSKEMIEALAEGMVITLG